MYLGVHKNGRNLNKCYIVIYFLTLSSLLLNTIFLVSVEYERIKRINVVSLNGFCYRHT